jgi:CreA protein
VHLLRGIVLLFAILALKTTPARSDDLACLSTTFRFIGANDKVCVSAFDDPKVPGVACHISQARTGGVKGSLGLAEDPSRFSIACRQVGPITVDITKLPAEESAYSERTSIFFKHTHVYRIVDKKRNTLVYIAISDKIIEGSPQNSISTVPIMPWGRWMGSVSDSLVSGAISDALADVKPWNRAAGPVGTEVAMALNGESSCERRWRAADAGSPVRRGSDGSDNKSPHTAPTCLQDATMDIAH